MCWYAFMYMYIEFASVYVCIHVYTHRIHTLVCVYINVYTHGVYMCMCVYLRVCTQSSHVCVYTFTYMDTAVVCGYIQA